MRKFVTILLGSAICLCTTAQVIELKNNWKFKPGDSLVWAKSDYNDTRWEPAIIGRAWEEQGYKGYDGYAWYRTRVTIPRSIKDKSALKDLIKFDLASVDNFDQVYLNGFLIGQNSVTMQGNEPQTDFTKDDVSWRTRRVYTLNCNDKSILWDRENVIAVRVFDTGGNGGIGLGIPGIYMVDVADYIKMVVKDFPFEIGLKNNSAAKFVRLFNSSGAYSFTGRLHILGRQAENNKILLDTLIRVALEPNSKKDVKFSIKTACKDYINITYSFTEDKSNYTVTNREYAPYFLTPAEPLRPQINNPLVYAARPGNPVFINLPVSGKEPVTYHVTGLPTGLSCDSLTGIITGSVSVKGEYTFHVKAINKEGTDEKDLKLKIGNELLLTPPMSWNSYYCFWNEVTGNEIKENAKLFKESGLINHGYTYFNVDDGWPGTRDANNIITGNEKFGDMKALGAYIHQQGLKFGIYSSPGPRTCGGFAGSYQYEHIDAKTYQSWGVDYLKYDWCSYDDVGDFKKLSDLKKPYILMRQALDSVPRDIVYSLCQYGMGDVWTWGKQIGGNLWRTTLDIVDSWESFKYIGFQQYKFSEFAGPDGWNDPDMLQIGWFKGGRELHPSNLTIPEQYTQFTLWALLSSPLMLSCDFSKLDEQTKNIIANDEVIAIDQDPLGKPAKRVFDINGFQAYLKNLDDGSHAIGLFNLTEADTSFVLKFADLGLSQFQNLRDVWRQKDWGIRNGYVKVFLPSHGSALFKSKNADKSDLRSYHESWVRYLMADILLGGDKDYYRQFPEDANSNEAIRRLNKGITIVNLEMFERKMVPGKNIRVVKKGTLLATSGNDIKLSTDARFDENKIRSILLNMALGTEIPTSLKQEMVQYNEAVLRDSVGVKISNLTDFKAGTTKPGRANNKKIILTSDVDYDEDIVCYMLADIALGGPVDFYQEIFDTWRDPNAGEAVRRFKDGLKISNLQKFARVDLPGKGIKIVLNGTSKIISGTEIELTKH